MTTGIFHSKVAGVTAEDTNGRLRQDYIRAFCRPGMPILLVPEPDNAYDKNAIAVWIKARAFFFFTSNVQIGYLNKDIAPEIARHIASGGTVTGQITEVTGGSRGKETLGVNIVLTKG